MKCNARLAQLVEHLTLKKQSAVDRPKPKRKYRLFPSRLEAVFLCLKCRNLSFFPVFTQIPKPNKANHL